VPSSIQVRPFRRGDRDQLTQLVNAHVAAVVPGVSVSVHTVLSQLERQPGEFITDPWVSDRATLVAEQGGRVQAAAHLLCYYADERAGEHYRNLGQLRWFVFWPEAPAGNPWWPAAGPAADALMNRCLAQLDQWGVSHRGADGDLPAPGVYGLPAQWPHVRAAYERAGFTHTGGTEAVYLARVAGLARPARPPRPGVALSRTVGLNGTRLSAVAGPDVLGYIEVEEFADGEPRLRQGSWAEIGNLRVAPGCRRQGVGRWLLGQAASWLDLAGVSRLLDYAPLADQDAVAYRSFLAAAGFTELTRTARGWDLDCFRDLRCGPHLRPAPQAQPAKGRISPGGVPGVNDTPRRTSRAPAARTVRNDSAAPGALADSRSVIATSLFGSAPWSPLPLTVEVMAQIVTVPSRFTRPVMFRSPSVAGDQGSPVIGLSPDG
jgi:GNAT superfamily N-acetyltransferase